MKRDPIFFQPRLENSKMAFMVILASLMVIYLFQKSFGVLAPIINTIAAFLVSIFLVGAFVEPYANIKNKYSKAIVYFALGYLLLNIKSGTSELDNLTFGASLSLFFEGLKALMEKKRR